LPPAFFLITDAVHEPLPAPFIRCLRGDPRLQAGEEIGVLERIRALDEPASGKGVLFAGIWLVRLLSVLLDMLPLLVKYLSPAGPYSSWLTTRMPVSDSIPTGRWPSVSAGGAGGVSQTRVATSRSPSPDNNVGFPGHNEAGEADVS
jgi:hypothetical protein